jgi:hypothetical protein
MAEPYLGGCTCSFAFFYLEVFSVIAAESLLKV